MQYRVITKALSEGKTVRLVGRTTRAGFMLQKDIQHDLKPFTETGRRVDWNYAHVKWYIQTFRANELGTWIEPLRAEII